jgi:hypothetical protein
MKPTKAERECLFRFGCFLRLPEGIFYVAWAWPTLKTVKEAQVLIRLVPGSSDRGCLLSVAIEVSPVRFLPRYAFYPFDLRKEQHRKCLESILQAGKFQLCFVQGSKSVRRILNLPQSQIPRLANIYKKTLERMETPKGGFKFSEAIREFEQTERATEHFPRAITETELEHVGKLLRENISPSSAAITQQELFLRRIIDSLHQQHGPTISKWLEGFEGIVTALHAASEIYTLFDREPQLLAAILSRSYASAPMDIAKLDWVPEAANSICGMLVRLQDSPPEQKEQLFIAMAQAAQDFGRRLSEENHVSWKEFLKLLFPIKDLLTGSPGRPRLDSSSLWQLKRTEKMSWSKVTEKTYNNSPTLQNEFGKSTYAELSYENRHKVNQRVRGRVRRHEARRKSIE